MNEIGILQGSFEEVACVNESGLILSDKICEENIKLFMR